MFELIDNYDMKEGEMYFIKRFETILGELIFVKYHTFENLTVTFATFSYPYMCGYSNLCLFTLSIYRYVSEEEYWEKVKEKYDAKCLNIVLKRLIDDSFEW